MTIVKEILELISNYGLFPVLATVFGWLYITSNKDHIKTLTSLKDENKEVVDNLREEQDKNTDRILAQIACQNVAIDGVKEELRKETDKVIAKVDSLDNKYTNIILSQRGGGDK